MKVSFHSILWLACAVLFLGCGKKENKTGTTPLVNYESIRDQAVKLVEEGKIPAATPGAPNLPENLRSASTDGRVIFSRDATSGLVCVFNLSVVASSRQEFLVYLEKAPDNVNGLRVDVAGLLIVIRQKVDGHWYQAAMGR